MSQWGGSGYWSEYVPVAVRIEKAKKEAEKLRKKGVNIQPVLLSGKKISTSFWGKGWCDHMESFHDYENRLPRGRSYVRNGSVVHLDVSEGIISALVAGTKVYKVEIHIDLLPDTRWQRIKEQCAGQISSLMDLLRGELSNGVMQIVADRDNGLFPSPKEIKMGCSCPDHAGLCKHIAAVFYGVGARLDSRPELLFLLRGVDHAELAADGAVDAVIDKGRGGEDALAGADLAEVFGIDLVDTSTPIAIEATPAARASATKTRRETPKKAEKKKPVTQAKPDAKTPSPAAGKPFKKMVKRNKPEPQPSAPPKPAKAAARRSDTAVKSATERKDASAIAKKDRLKS